MKTSSLVLGIDLGTSNCAVYLGDTEKQTLTSFPLCQLEAPGRVVSKKTMPSALYIPTAEEKKQKAFHLPWTKDTEEVSSVIGNLAFKKASESSQRVVLSAKSWLCHSQIPRKENNLPWCSSIDYKTSSYDTTKSYLQHIYEALQFYFKEKKLKVDCSKVQTTITVPASFDEVARNLTFEAAKEAGFKKLNLLEEPQAAFYSWIDSCGKDWVKQISAGDIVLVCDVGGGTTDLSLIYVTEDEEKNLSLERICVGRHILLGGDNMDLALAYCVKNKFMKSNIELDKWQFIALTQQVKVAKEKLFSEEELTEVPVAVAGRGSSLFAKTVKEKLTRDELYSILLDGFFPVVDCNSIPANEQNIGLLELGLNYEKDPAITKHIATFLRTGKNNIDSSSELKEKLSTYISSQKGNSAKALSPTAVLFNGGVFKSLELRSRVLDILQKWSGKISIRELKGTDFDTAVAKGASYFARICKEGKGLKIRSGTAHSYYLGLESGGMAIPGINSAIKGVCIVPQGTEEGEKIENIDRQFGLVTGQAVKFRFFNSESRAGDKVGVCIDDAESQLHESSELEITLPSTQKDSQEVVPVKLDAFVNDVGILELNLKHLYLDKKWKLEFNVRNSD